MQSIYVSTFDNRFSAHRTNVILLDPFQHALVVENMFVITFQLHNLFTNIRPNLVFEIVKAYNASLFFIFAFDIFSACVI